MIIWLASYPRSGNTFLRLVLYRLYGARSSTVYDVDGVAERLGADLVGFDERPRSINAMRAADAVYFMKTHRQRDSQVDESDPAVCLVRDGRDAMVSYAHLTSEGDATQFAPMLRSLICRHDEVGTGNWGRNVLSWLLPPADHRLVLRYEDLVCDPEGAVNHLMAKLLPQLTPLIVRRYRRSPSSKPSMIVSSVLVPAVPTSSTYPKNYVSSSGRSQKTARPCSYSTTREHQSPALQRADSASATLDRADRPSDGQGRCCVNRSSIGQDRIVR